MKGYTITRTKEDIPASQQGFYNICTLLGIFNLLNVLKTEDIRVFLDKFDIKPQKNEPIENTITNILKGVKRGREAQSSTKKKIPYIFLLLFLSLSGIAILYQTIKDTPEGNPLAIVASQQPISCDQSFPKSDAVFLSDQMFSQYLPSIIAPGSSILTKQVRSIGINEDGAWFGYLQSSTYSDKISFYNGQAFIHFCLGASLENGQNINSFAFLNDKIYIATDGAGIGEFDGSDWYFYTQENNLPDNRVYTLTVNNEELWAATYGGVAVFVDGVWKHEFLDSPKQIANQPVIEFIRDNEGNSWFGFIRHGIARLSATGEWFSYFADDQNLREIRGIVITENGTVWFATDKGGIIRYDNGNWSIFNVTDNQLPSNTVRDIEIDKYGRMWIATDKGVAYTPNIEDMSVWKTHSTLDVLDIAFGCNNTNCNLYTDVHMWLSLAENGVAHVRIPPLEPTIEVMQVPSKKQLSPGETYVFEVTIKVLSEQLTAVDGDSLRSNLPNDAFLYGAYPIIPVSGEPILPGGLYIFSNEDNPIIAPNEPGIYRTVWRVWQGRRAVTEPIVIEFEVIE